VNSIIRERKQIKKVIYLESSDDSSSHCTKDSDTDFDPNDESENESVNISTVSKRTVQMRYLKTKTYECFNKSTDLDDGSDNEIHIQSYPWVEELKELDINPGKNSIFSFDACINI
jgi:hypothetical protein